MVDRSHQAPLASFSGTPHWVETNHLSNITPQRSELNQGPWEELESAERRLAQSAGGAAVYVVTGPLYERAMLPLPRAEEPHQVPSGYWKVIAIETGDLAAFLFEQETPRSGDYCAHEATLDEVEQRSELDLLPFAGDAEIGDLSSALGCAE